MIIVKSPPKIVTICTRIKFSPQTPTITYSCQAPWGLQLWTGIRIRHQATVVNRTLSLVGMYKGHTRIWPHSSRRYLIWTTTTTLLEWWAVPLAPKFRWPWPTTKTKEDLRAVSPTCREETTQTATEPSSCHQTWWATTLWIGRRLTLNNRIGHTQ